MQAADNHRDSGQQIRCAKAPALAAALRQGRKRLLDMFSGFEEQLGPGNLAIALDPVLNLPLWELGHIGWFEEWWIARNPARNAGAACDPTLPRSPSLLPGADTFYDSSRIPHAARWQLGLPGAADTRRYLTQVREQTLEALEALEQGGQDDEALYFFRLVLFHEDMHREAWFMMAQQLGLDLGVAMPNAVIPAASTTSAWSVAAAPHRMGAAPPGFAFDNELRAHDLSVAAFTIDRQVVSWHRFLPFAKHGGYEDERLWTPAGWQWRQQHSSGAPQHLRPATGTKDAWEQQRFGRWLPLELNAPAVHLSAHEAAAWCRFAGRRLPSEAEWEAAARLAVEQSEPFDWGQVWEWTATPFTPYAGFVAHPYRDYSEPFFDGRPVLRGGSVATEPRMLHPAYRNYFTADRRDAFAGFRSCAL